MNAYILHSCYNDINSYVENDLNNMTVYTEIKI